MNCSCGFLPEKMLLLNYLDGSNSLIAPDVLRTIDNDDQMLNGKFVEIRATFRCKKQILTRAI